uniref:CCHC-type domain-containing protein n=1 Tax=Nicotiana tabacum TaxID=4097 RepID=A0A1S3XGV1_TOBAC|nr:PREDICTED: uncharacterized protein LOC107765098 [Nicotiana tabacum]
MFDKKPMVVKPWRPDIKFDKQVVDKIPVWIRLMNLDIKYWGQNAVTKIAGMKGNRLKADRATTQKQRLRFARILVKVEPDKMYPDMVMFGNECGVIIEQEVIYEWKPVFCKACGNFGHDIRECRKQLRQDKAREEINKETGNNNTNGYKEKEKPEEQQHNEARDITPIENGSNKDKNNGMNDGEERSKESQLEPQGNGNKSGKVGGPKPHLPNG